MTTYAVSNDIPFTAYKTHITCLDRDSSLPSEFVIRKKPVFGIGNLHLFDSAEKSLHERSRYEQARRLRFGDLPYGTFLGEEMARHTYIISNHIRRFAQSTNFDYAPLGVDEWDVTVFVKGREVPFNDLANIRSYVSSLEETLNLYTAFIEAPAEMDFGQGDDSHLFMQWIENYFKNEVMFIPGEIFDIESLFLLTEMTGTPTMDLHETVYGAYAEFRDINPDVFEPGYDENCGAYEKFRVLEYVVKNARFFNPS